MTYVIIVHHRGEALLRRCLETVLASSNGAELQVIVVGNACHEPMPELAENHERVHIVHSQLPIGFSEANNLGVAWGDEQLGRPDVYLFLNNDTLVEPDAIERLEQSLGGDDKVGIVGPRLMIFGGQDHLNSLGLNVTLTGEAWDEGIGQSLAAYGELPDQEVLAVTGAALAVRSAVFHELDGWAPFYKFYFEDIDFCLRARSRGWKVACIHQAVIWHAISATAARGSDFKRVLSWRNRFLLLFAHWPWSLLVKIAAGVVYSEVRLFGRRLYHRALADARLQFRSWGGTVKHMFKALRARRLRGRHTEWVAELHPHGSVPVIQLPPLDADPLA